MSNNETPMMLSNTTRQEVPIIHLVVILLVIQIALSGVLVYRISRVEAVVSEGKTESIQSPELKFEPNIQTEGYPSKGPENASITIIEFGDYQCPYCKQAEETINQLFQTYPGKIRLVFRNYPIPSHPYALEAADQDKFWEMHDSLFAEQDLISSTHLPQIATSLGLNMDQWNACMNSHQHKDAIQADAMEGVALGVTGTPNFFVNGYLLPYAGSLSDFKNLIAKTQTDD